MQVSTLSAGRQEGRTSAARLLEAILLRAPCTLHGRPAVPGYSTILLTPTQRSRHQRLSPSDAVRLESLTPVEEL